MTIPAVVQPEEFEMPSTSNRAGAPFEQIASLEAKLGEMVIDKEESPGLGEGSTFEDGETVQDVEIQKFESMLRYAAQHLRNKGFTPMFVQGDPVLIPSSTLECPTAETSPLSLLNNPSKADVILQVGSQCYYAHWKHLKSHPYFAAHERFTHGEPPSSTRLGASGVDGSRSTTRHIYLDLPFPYQFPELLRYLYTGNDDDAKLLLNERHLLDTLMNADFLAAELRTLLVGIMLKQPHRVAADMAAVEPTTSSKDVGGLLSPSPDLKTLKDLSPYVLCKLRRKYANEFDMAVPASWVLEIAERENAAMRLQWELATCAGCIVDAAMSKSDAKSEKDTLAGYETQAPLLPQALQRTQQHEPRNVAKWVAAATLMGGLFLFLSAQDDISVVARDSTDPAETHEAGLLMSVLKPTWFGERMQSEVKDPSPLVPGEDESQYGHPAPPVDALMSEEIDRSGFNQGHPDPEELADDQTRRVYYTHGHNNPKQQLANGDEGEDHKHHHKHHDHPHHKHHGHGHGHGHGSKKHHKKVRVHKEVAHRHRHGGKHSEKGDGEANVVGSASSSEEGEETKPQRVRAKYTVSSRRRIHKQVAIDQEGHKRVKIVKTQEVRKKLSFKALPGTNVETADDHAAPAEQRTGSSISILFNWLSKSTRWIFGKGSHHHPCADESDEERSSKHHDVLNRIHHVHKHSHHRKIRKIHHKQHHHQNDHTAGDGHNESGLAAAVRGGRRPGRGRPKPKPESCAVAPAQPEDRRINKDELTIANFNAEWLFIQGGSGAMRCPGSNCPWKDLKMAEAHFDRIAERIASMGYPDIVHVTEVEGCTALDKLAKIIDEKAVARKEDAQYLRNGTVGYKFYLVPGKDIATGQNVGLLTKIDPSQDLVRSEERAEYPIEGSTCNWSDPDEPKFTYGVSKHYLTRFEVNGKGIIFSGNHFLAFPDKRDRCEKREAQAVVVSQLIKKQLSQHPSDTVIVLGDFNDYDAEVEDAAGEIDHPISKALTILRHNSTTSSTSKPLFNLANAWTNQTERFTVWYDRNRNCRDDGGVEHVMIDHVLVGEWLKKRLVESGPLHTYGEFCGKLDSDHWPTFARFDLTG
ncbi:hypothetical protein HK102_000857 [Quaeritorhiza haematococci]|nr:hypothetical protein HK102_000857 [Quaeritorhiza haematococci]